MLIAWSAVRRSPSNPSKNACRLSVVAFVGVTRLRIAAWVRGGEARGRVQRLIRVAHYMDERRLVTLRAEDVN